MIKRAALARALALDPEIVFLDEPTSGLDPIGAGRIRRADRDAEADLGLTVFMVTHDLDSLYSACDRIAALADKRVIAVGPLATMLASDHPWLKAYFGGERASARLPAERTGEASDHGIARQLCSGRTVHARGARRRCSASSTGSTAARPARKQDVRIIFSGTVTGLGPRLERAVQRPARRRGHAHRAAAGRSAPDLCRRSRSISSTPLRVDTRARIEAQGLAGVVAVQLARRRSEFRRR